MISDHQRNWFAIKTGCPVSYQGVRNHEQPTGPWPDLHRDAFAVVLYDVYRPWRAINTCV